MRNPRINQRFYRGFRVFRSGFLVEKGVGSPKAVALRAIILLPFKVSLKEYQAETESWNGRLLGGGLGANFWAGRAAFEKPISIVGEWGAYRTEIYFV